MGMKARHSPHSDSWFEYHRWHFDIDKYINPLIPAPRWHRLPRPIAHFMGHRHEAPKAMGNLLIALWTLVSVFCGVAIVTAVTMRVPAFQRHHSPDVIASFVSHICPRRCILNANFLPGSRRGSGVLCY